MKEAYTSPSPYILALSNQVFILAVKARLVQPWDEAVGTSYSVLPGPGGARAEAERRRSVTRPLVVKFR